jgi:hypothetical protein
MAGTTNTNGRAQRKSLSEQIDRLDAVLDGLAEGINDTVVSAVQEAVQAAVRTAVVEVLTNDGLQRRLRPAAGPPARRAGRLAGRAWGLLRGLARIAAAGWSKAAAAFRKAGARGAESLGLDPGAACARAAAACGLAASAARAAWARVLALRGLAGRFRRPVLVALGVGSAASVLAYLSGPWAAAAAGWLSGFVTTLAVQAGAALRKLLRAPTSNA